MSLILNLNDRKVTVIKGNLICQKDSDEPYTKNTMIFHEKLTLYLDKLYPLKSFQNMSYPTVFRTEEKGCYRNL